MNAGYSDTQRHPALDLERYRGPGQFGPAYRYMLEHDAHAPGSVDRALVESMVLICPETALYLYKDYTPLKLRYRKGSRPQLEARLAQATAGRTATISTGEKIAAIAAFCASLGEHAPDNLNDMLLGGREEEIIRRGSDWCTDVARVACALCQVAGIPARLVFLADSEQAYSGHAIIEAYRGRAWGAVDASTGVIYRHKNGTPATTWDLMQQPQLVEAHKGFYSTAQQFRRAAVSNYFIWKSERYDYAVSGLNDYYRSILEMSARGWPGGLRWLHGEDKGNS